jgi:hypothetical protein
MSAAPHGRTGWTYTETVDEPGSTISVHGRVDRLGVDLLRGTVEELARRGHRDITVAMDDDVVVGPPARTELHELAAELADRHGQLTIRWPHRGERPG